MSMATAATDRKAFKTFAPFSPDRPLRCESPSILELIRIPF
jgi:hypothetical protein